MPRQHVTFTSTRHVHVNTSRSRQHVTFTSTSHVTSKHHVYLKTLRERIASTSTTLRSQPHDAPRNPSTNSKTSLNHAKPAFQPQLPQPRQGLPAQYGGETGRIVAVSCVECVDPGLRRLRRSQSVVHINFDPAPPNQLHNFLRYSINKAPIEHVGYHSRSFSTLKLPICITLPFHALNARFQKRLISPKRLPTPADDSR